jgi:aspartate racemase
MKVIGLIGGMSWESSAQYYRLINREVRERLGGQHSAELLLYSVDFHETQRMQHEGRWEDAAEHLVSGARRLERAGAELVVLCTNTMHKLAAQIERSIGIPFLHIADATGDEIRGAGLSIVGLLGTRFTMEQDFYRGHLASRFGLRVLVPGPASREVIHGVIYDELCRGLIREPSRGRIRAIIEELAGGGAEGVILGCTELPLLIRPEDSPIPVFDTTWIHARRAVDLALRSDAPGGV